MALSIQIIKIFRSGKLLNVVELHPTTYTKKNLLGWEIIWGSSGKHGTYPTSSIDHLRQVVTGGLFGLNLKRCVRCNEQLKTVGGTPLTEGKTRRFWKWPKNNGVDKRRRKSRRIGMKIVGNNVDLSHFLFGTFFEKVRIEIHWTKKGFEWRRHGMLNQHGKHFSCCSCS